MSGGARITNAARKVRHHDDRIAGGQALRGLVDRGQTARRGQDWNQAANLLDEAHRSIDAAAGPDRSAEITGLDISRVAVKATTSERLGFTGREEGIAATASATIRLPWTDKGWTDKGWGDKGGSD